MRSTARDNLATADCPVWRYRYRTPLTPRAVRNGSLAEGNINLTALDKALDDDQANALEDYWQAELVLSGNARCGDYTGDRVMTSREYMTPIADRWLPLLVKHYGVKVMLTERDRFTLALFCEQMNGADLSDAQCALKMGLPGRDKSAAWVSELARISSRLV